MCKLSAAAKQMPARLSEARRMRQSTALRRLACLQLDEALDFNGNIIFGAIGNACIGCTAWQKSFNVMARWSLTLACLSQWFCWAPWAFQESIATVHRGKSTPLLHNI